MKAELVPDNGDPPIPIVKDVTVVGRREYCDVRINDESLSKRHAVVVKTDGLLVIRDLATTNGTKVKGQRVRWAALLPDDRISFGNYKMRIYLGPDNVPGPSELGGKGARNASAPSTRVAAAPPPVPAPVLSTAKPPSEFPDLSHLDGPSGNVMNADGLDILDEGEDEAGWQRLISSRSNENELIIDLD